MKYKVGDIIQESHYSQFARLIIGIHDGEYVCIWADDTPCYPMKYKIEYLEKTFDVDLVTSKKREWNQQLAEILSE